LFTGPGYYLRDCVLIVIIAVSPLVGAEVAFKMPARVRD
jgi:hypothetical protein